MEMQDIYPEIENLILEEVLQVRCVLLRRVYYHAVRGTCQRWRKLTGAIYHNICEQREAILIQRLTVWSLARYVYEGHGKLIPELKLHMHINPERRSLIIPKMATYFFYSKGKIIKEWMKRAVEGLWQDKSGVVKYLNRLIDEMQINYINDIRVKKVRIYPFCYTDERSMLYQVIELLPPEEGQSITIEELRQFWSHYNTNLPREYMRLFHY
jgi:hypothetical protein